MKDRFKAIENFSEQADLVQHNELVSLLNLGKNTEIGKKYDFKSISTEEVYRERVPIQTYEELKPYVERMLKGEQNILWHSEVKRFSKSSGTTSSKSKFIPVSDEALKDCHYKGGKDMYAMYVNNFPESNIFFGKNMAMGGSLHSEDGNDIFCGDISALIMQDLPVWAQIRREPSIDIALMDNWEVKIEAMTNSTIKQDITNLAGVPSWILIFLKRVLEKSGKEKIVDVWPNLEAFFHGGVSFSPYRKQYENIIGCDKFNYVETYNASEGFFGIQDTKEGGDMLLMLDYGIYYEFMPLEELGKDKPKCIGIKDVKLGVNYALIITTNAGLWRYMIGDTIKFTSLKPYRIIVSGRTKCFINAFGEELIVDNADNAIAYACKKNNAEISEYTAGPIFLEAGKQAAHQWLIEFKKAPEDINVFIDDLDYMLKQVNSDYEAKRYKDIMLKKPVVEILAEGSFYKWMKHKGRLGGQNKVARLANNREYIEELLSF